MPRDLSFRSDDDRFGLHVPRAEVARMLERCRTAFPHETGGILVGIYNESRNCAEVRLATGPGRDARAGRTWFERGVAGLQEVLHAQWRDRRGYYLGEWHYHPGAEPEPSSADDLSMRQFAASPLYHCPEPALLIIGGGPAGAWRFSASVFPRGSASIRLK